jgi:hypothetical protein
MHHYTIMKNHLHNQIMRRVYYSFVISISTHAMFWRGMFLGAAALLLAQWLHVASITQNLLATPVGNTPQYVANSFLAAIDHGEVLTVVLFVLASIIAISCTYRLGQAFFSARVVDLSMGS